MKIIDIVSVLCCHLKFVLIPCFIYLHRQYFTDNFILFEGLLVCPTFVRILFTCIPKTIDSNIYRIFSEKVNQYENGIQNQGKQDNGLLFFK